MFLPYEVKLTSKLGSWGCPDNTPNVSISADLLQVLCPRQLGTQSAQAFLWLLMLLLNCTGLKAMELRPIIMETSPEVGENSSLAGETDTSWGFEKACSNI